MEVLTKLLNLWQEIDGELVWEATLDTIAMTGYSLLFTVLIGLPLGILLFLLSPNQALSNRWIYSVLSLIVNILRSLPFIILLIIVIPLTRLIVGTTIGVSGVIPPLVISAVPYFARLIENVIKEIDLGILETMESMGATTWQTVRYAIIPEALTGIIGAITVCAISLIGYTAMAGVVGGGGLGDVAIRYGYNRYEPGMLWATVPILIIMVNFVQYIGDALTRKFNRR